MFSIFRKEISTFLHSLVGYIVIGLFLTGMGLFMWVYPETSIINYGYADMSTFFRMAPFLYLFLVPAITMRSFADEQKSGTMELLLTKPLTDYQIIWGKYLAALFLILFSLLPTLVYYGSIYYLGQPVGNIDSARVLGSYIGMFLLGAVFASVGLFASSLTESQIVAFLLAVFLCFTLHSGFQSLANINVWGQYSLLVSQMGIAYHYEAISKGLVDSRNLLYFLTVIALMLMATKLVMSSRQW